MGKRLGFGGALHRAGTLVSGAINAYRWRSTLDGDLSSQANFRSTKLSPGNHIVLFAIQDGSGNWSLETT